MEAPNAAKKSATEGILPAELPSTEERQKIGADALHELQAPAFVHKQSVTAVVHELYGSESNAADGKKTENQRV